MRLISRVVRAPRARFAAALLALGIPLACLGSARPPMAAGAPTCAAATETTVKWQQLSAANERHSLDRWCAGVGPSVVRQHPYASATLTPPFAVVSWNTHVGAGDLDVFIADLRAGRLTRSSVNGFVLLLQEAYRSGDAVPDTRSVLWASAIFGAGPRSSRVEATRLAERLGLSALYVPSMRNGPPGVTAEDRGNAILSTAQLHDISALELPLERQRRVAVAATIMAQSSGTSSIPIRVLSTHFTNMVMHHAWILSES